MMKTVDILAFSPHPDDAEFGCGGGLILSVIKGFRVAIVDLTEGECSSRGSSLERKDEKERATSLMGLFARYSLGLPDTGISVGEPHMIAMIELIRELRPRVVLAPYWHDRHPDHEAAGKLLRSACFYSGVASIGEKEPFRPNRVFYYMIHSPFSPSFVVDISSVWEQKKEVLQVYRTQFSREDPLMYPTAISDPGFMDYHETRCIYFGAMIGVRYGEPFFTHGPIYMDGFPGAGDLGSRDGRSLVYQSI